MKLLTKVLSDSRRIRNPRTMLRDLWSIDRGPSTVYHGHTVNCGLWTVDCGLCTLTTSNNLAFIYNYDPASAGLSFIKKTSGFMKTNTINRQSIIPACQPGRNYGPSTMDCGLTSLKKFL